MEIGPALELIDEAVTTTGQNMVQLVERRVIALVVGCQQSAIVPKGQSHWKAKAGGDRLDAVMHSLVVRGVGRKTNNRAAPAGGGR